MLESVYAMVLQNMVWFLVSGLQDEKEVQFIDNLRNTIAGSGTTSAGVDACNISSVLSSVDASAVGLNFLTTASTRPFLQWFVDYCLHFSRLILSSGTEGWTKAFLNIDKAALTSTKLLLCLMHIALQKSPGAINVIQASTLPLNELVTKLYSLISKISILTHSRTKADIDESDCAMSSLPLMYIPIPTDCPQAGVLSQPLHLNEGSEFVFQLLQESWVMIKQLSTENPLSVGAETMNSGSRQIFDAIALVPSSLSSTDTVKVCCRCFGLTLEASKKQQATAPLNSAWLAKWQDHCICGGFWKEVRWQEN